MAAISAVFTIAHVAALLGEDAEWLHELSIDMFPEDGCLSVYGVGEDSVRAFTPFGIDCLREIIDELRSTGSAPPKAGTGTYRALRCSPDAYFPPRRIAGPSGAAPAGPLPPSCTASTRAPRSSG